MERPSVSKCWMNSSPHHSSNVVWLALLEAQTPNSSVVDDTDLLLCWPGGTSAIKLGHAGTFRKSSKWVSSHFPDFPMPGFENPGCPRGTCSSTGIIVVSPVAV